MRYPLTAEQRRVTCVHEAAHAIVGALGGFFIRRAHVAPVGSADQVLGAVQMDDAWAYAFLQWNAFKYDADRLGFNESVRQGAMPAAAVRRETRAGICTGLAGPIASQIAQGEPVGLRQTVLRWNGEADDFAEAEGMCRLLHRRCELPYLHDCTEQLLRHPAVWRRVLALADELDAAGDLDDDRLDRHLPQPLRNWPSPPPRVALKRNKTADYF